MLFLKQVGTGGAQVFDLAVMPDDAQAAEQATVATLVYAALLTDARAAAGVVQDGRRGWWADPAAGSLLWVVRRQALGSAARREAIDMVRQALVQRAPALSEIAVVDVTPAGTVSVVALEVTGKHNGTAFSIGLSV